MVSSRQKNAVKLWTIKFNGYKFVVKTFWQEQCFAWKKNKQKIKPFISGNKLNFEESSIQRWQENKENVSQNQKTSSQFIYVW